jgi:hypothetical protein
MELPHTMQLVAVRGQPIGMILAHPTGAGVRADGERPELIEGEHPIRKVGGDVLYPGQLGISVGVCGLLPGLWSAER